nr:hypothetical protein [Lacimicrobium alkaliphilum]
MDGIAQAGVVSGNNQFNYFRRLPYYSVAGHQCGAADKAEELLYKRVLVFVGGNNNVPPGNISFTKNIIMAIMRLWLLLT